MIATIICSEKVFIPLVIGIGTILIFSCFIINNLNIHLFINPEDIGINVGRKEKNTD